MTVAALGALLLNDLLLKSVWPHSWSTGKLSDLAWLVFALPLLAFLLSFLARGSLRSQRITFLAAYGGLPLLYAAFNTFDPVHNCIMHGISLVGGAATSPRDATDSLVIPLALGIGLWVWYRARVKESALRQRWALLVAGVASLASIATDGPSPVPGVKYVGVMGDGEIVALTIDGDSYYPLDEAGHYIVDEIDDGRDHHRSVDGGMTWSLMEERLETFPWGDESVYTPRGSYTLDGPRVIRVDSDDGQGQVAYATAYLQEGGNTWIQSMATKGLDEGRELATEPQGLAYDERSSNLVIGLGIQGVVVGKPDGEWVGVPVDRFAPTDFTFWTKTRLLALNFGFWITALTLAVSMTGAGLVLSQYRVIKLLPLTLAALVSLLASVALLGVFGVPGNRIEALVIWLAITAWVLSAVCLARTLPQLKYRRVVAWTTTGMTALVFLAFMLWLHLGLSHETTKAAVIVLCGLAAIVLAGYVRRMGPKID